MGADESFGFFSSDHKYSSEFLLQNFLLNDILTVFPIQMHDDLCCHCCKIGQGHHRAMINIQIVVLGQCYKPSFVKTRPLVPEKIFEGFLPYMDMATILIMQPDILHPLSDEAL